VFQGAHVAVAQRVEDECQLAPGSCDPAGVAAATVGDPFPQYSDRAAFGTVLTDSIAAHEPDVNPAG